MKKIWLAILISMSMVSMLSAQGMTQAEKEEFEKFKQFQQMKTITLTPAEAVGRFAGLGREIGTALKESVQALDEGITVTEEHVYKFAGTGVGKITIGILAWKIAGKDILGVIVGFALLGGLVIWVCQWIRFFFVGKMIVDKKTVKGFWSTEKTYARVKASDSMSPEAYTFWCLVFAIGGLMLFIGSMVCFFG